MAVLFALIALVGWGTGDIFVAKLSRRIGNRIAMFWWLSISFLIGSLYLPFAGAVSDWRWFVFAIILNFFGTVGVLWYFQALEIGHTSLVGTIAGAFPVITVPLSIILFAEKLTGVQAAAIALTIVGLVLSTLHWEDIKNRDFARILKQKGIQLSFFTLFIWGIYWTVIRYPIERIGWFWSLYPFYFFFLLLPLFKLIKRIPFEHLKQKRTLMMIILMCVLTAIANFSFNYGISIGYTSIVAPIGGSSPVLFVLLSRYFFREPLSGQQKLGIVFVLAGIVLIGLTSV